MAVVGAGKYVLASERLKSSEHNTLMVSFADVEEHSRTLAQVLLEDWYRLYAHLCAALHDVASARHGVPASKQLFLGITHLPLKIKSLPSCLRLPPRPQPTLYPPDPNPAFIRPATSPFSLPHLPSHAPGSSGYLVCFAALLG